MFRPVFVLLACAVAVALSASTYTDKYDNVDIDEILNNERLYKKYFDCLRNTGKCTPDGKELKEHLPDALATGCSKCTEKQKKGSDKVIKHIYNKKPEDYAVLEKLYDPEGAYKKKYEAQGKSLGISS